jgi:hypothetical protein
VLKHRKIEKGTMVYMEPGKVENIAEGLSTTDRPFLQVYVLISILP